MELTITLRMMREQCIENGGFTWLRGASVLATSGFVVGVADGDWRVVNTSTPSESEIYEALRDLPTEATGFGAWVDGSRTVFDPIQVYDNVDDAMSAARTYGQTHIYDLTNGATLEAVA